MRCLTRFSSVMVMGMLLVPSGGMKIKDSHFKFENYSYFREGASSVQLGSYGDKRSPVTRGNYLFVDGTISASKLGKIDKVEIPEVNYDSVDKGDLFANVDKGAFEKSFKVSAEVAWNKITSNELSLIKLTLDSNSLRKAANSSPKVLDQLRSRGHGARLVNTVFVVVTAKFASTLSHSTSIELEGSNGTMTINAKGSVSSDKETSYTLGEGTTFAYGLVKIDWDRGKDKIENLNPDQWGG